MTLMWTGGAESLETRYPDAYWVLPSSLKTLFDPKDAPYIAGVMTAVCISAAAMPISGIPFGKDYFEYAHYYELCYNGTPPAEDDDVEPVHNLLPSECPSPIGTGYTTDPDIGSILTYVEAIEDRIGLYSEGQTVMADLAAIYAQVTGGVEDPPPLASSIDTARVLAGIYYIAKQMVAPAVAPNYDDILTAVEDARTNLYNQQNDADMALAAHDTLVNGKLDSLGASAVSISDDTGSIVATLAEWTPAAAAVASGYPGSSGVTQSTPHVFSGPLELSEAMDGCIVELTTIPAGTGKQTVNSHNSWQHMGWLAFLADDGLADELQWLNLEQAVYVPKRISEPTGLLLFPRIGSGGTVTPWVRLP